MANLIIKSKGMYGQVEGTSSKQAATHPAIRGENRVRGIIIDELVNSLGKELNRILLL